HHFSGVLLIGHSMNHCVFDDGLKQHAGDIGIQSFGIDVSTNGQTLAQHQLLNFEVVVQEVEFVGKRDELWAFVIEADAQKRAQAKNDTVGKCGIPFERKRGYHVQGVEQEMRVELGTQCV